MNKHSTNFLLDSVALVLLLLLAGTGLLMHYTLPPGSHSIEVWGLGRHDWGTIHYWIAVALIAGVALHIILHWGWVTKMIMGTRTPRSRQLRIAAAFALFIAVLAVSLAPVFGKKVHLPEAELSAGYHTDHGSDVAQGRPFDIRGSLTLAELGAQTGYSLPTLVEVLSLSPDTAPNARLRELADAHGFTMEQLRSTIDDLQQFTD